MNMLDVLDLPLKACPYCPAGRNIGEFFANYLVAHIANPDMHMDGEWIWHMYTALATNLQPCGDPWIKAEIVDGAVEDLSREEMAKADALLSGAVRARFGLELS